MSDGEHYGMPRWAVYVLPAACLASTYLLYNSRGSLMNWVYDFIAKGYSKGAGKEYLAGNFGPVSKELFQTELAVEGELPEELEGMYVRTGANPFFTPTKGYHWFDGDGMLHACRISKGRVSYVNRFVDTARLRQERAVKKPLFMKMGDAYGKRGVALMVLDKLRAACGGVDRRSGSGTANTALQFHAGRLLALHEGDLPYAIRILCNGLIETWGRMSMHPEWKGPFTAHPKLDPKTGELLFFGYQFNEQPGVHVGVMDAGGSTIKQWGVELTHPVMMHDCAMTENYFVVLHLPLVFDPKAMFRKGSLPFIFRPDLPARIGLLRRDQPAAARADVQWYELPGPGFMVFHVANSFEDAEGNVRIYACHLDKMTLDLDEDLQSALDLPRLHEYVLNPATGEAAVPRRMTDVWGDFPVCNPAVVGYPSRYAWHAVMDPSSKQPSFTGIAKMDLQATGDACVAAIHYPIGCFGGEAVFVPRTSELKDSQGEDDGYLVVYVYHSAEDCSHLHVYCARTMAQQPLATVRLPQRVPYGFHGTWVTAKQIEAQVSSL